VTTEVNRSPHLAEAIQYQCRVERRRGVDPFRSLAPALVFAFGTDIKTAGTASLLISLPTVTVGLVRYHSRRAFGDRRPLCDMVAPMSAGSVFGALVCSLTVGAVPIPVLKVGLGVKIDTNTLDRVILSE
jgi:uncharacterized protein